jgi:DNA-binding XRE family transcriptional regulator
MKKNNKRFNSSKDFGAFLGLSDLDMEIISRKKILIEKLKKARITQKISQTELALLLDTKQPAIARMESGLVSEVSLDFLAKVAIVLGVNFTLIKAKAA